MGKKKLGYFLRAEIVKTVFVVGKRPAECQFWLMDGALCANICPALERCPRVSACTAKISRAGQHSDINNLNEDPVHSMFSTIQFQRDLFISA